MHLLSSSQTAENNKSQEIEVKFIYNKRLGDFMKRKEKKKLKVIWLIYGLKIIINDISKNYLHIQI